MNGEPESVAPQSRDTVAVAPGTGALVPAEQRIGGLIVTVGGSPEQVAVSIRHHRPSYICWLCSQKSVEQIPAIIDKVGFDESYPRPDDFKQMVADADDIVDCYVAANRAVRHLLKDKGCEPADVVADITGGTKAMAATLALAAINDGLRLSYVGGKGRTKGGVGIVVDGTEVVHTVENPWKLFAVDEMRRLASRFNRYQFDAVSEIALSVSSRPGSPPEVREFARLMVSLASAYASWDRFEHKNAVGPMKNALGAADAAIELGQFGAFRDFVDGVRRNLEWLQRMQQETSGFSANKLLVESVFVDLVANASRRAEEGKYDDAVARLYRSVELLAQIALRSRGIEDTGKVPPEKIPDSIRADYERVYKGRNGTLQLPLYASFELLRAFGDELGARFADQREEIEKVIAARNHSILAHGTRPVGQAAFESLLAKVVALYGSDAAVPFPKLDL